MAFKMNGSPAKTGGISGTAGHSSALKMKAESALKQKNPKAKTYDEAFDAMDYVPGKAEGNEKAVFKENKLDKKLYQTKTKDAKATEGGRKSFTKAAKAWNMETYGTENPTSVANKGGMTKKELAAKHKANKNAKVDSKTTVTEPTKTQKVVTKGENKKTKIATKAAKRTAEVTENVTKKTSKISKKDAKKKFGKDSKEYLEAKKANLEAKESDRQGSKGGKKQSIFRRLSSKINERKQKKNQEKLDAKNDSPADMKDKY
jgi:hypothetical protein